LTISIILNAFNRLKYIDKQIEAIKSQSIKVNEIFVWQNAYSKKNSIILPKYIKHIKSSYNFGVWTRFSLALNCKSDYICIFDDDTIPGNNWLKNCLNTIKKKNGLLGARGVRFASDNEYIVGEEYGWNNPNNNIKEVDIVGHSWFFKREWLSYFWREIPEIASSIYVGEDIHFSYILQKYLNINTYVPPHPKDDKSLWGSEPNSAIKIGTDQHAISYDKKRLDEMDKTLKYYVSNGFKCKFLQKLKYKKLYLQSKKKIRKLIK